MELVQLPVDVGGEPADQPGEVALVLGWPVGEQRDEPLMAGQEEAADRFLPLGAEAQPAHPRILGAPGPADQAQA